jgi:hypothetical protein
VFICESAAISDFVDVDDHDERVGVCVTRLWKWTYDEDVFICHLYVHPFMHSPNCAKTHHHGDYDHH